MRMGQYKRTSIGLLGIWLITSVMEQAKLLSFIDKQVLQYGIVPLIWGITIFLMDHHLPQIHGIGKLRWRSTVYTWAFNAGVAWVLANILGGLVQGFGKSPYSHSPKGILMNLLFIVPALIGQEFIRSYWVNTFYRSYRNWALYGIIIVMSVMNMSLVKIVEISSIKELTIFAAEYTLPTICQNILATYLVLYGGPIASIIYVGMGEAFEWLIPILPDLDWLVKGVIGMGVPLIAWIVVAQSYDKLTKAEKAYRTSGEPMRKWLPTAIGCVFFIWFVVGVFPIYPSAIATGSMKPMIQPGDVVLVKKIQTIEEIEALQVGEVIQFQRGNIRINHRIIEVLEVDDQKMYRTKGDNNSTEDRELVKIQDIKGTIEHVIPKVGWPTLILKSEDPDILDEVEF